MICLLLSWWWWWWWQYYCLFRNMCFMSYYYYVWWVSQEQKASWQFFVFKKSQNQCMLYDMVLGERKKEKVCVCMCACGLYKEKQGKTPTSHPIWQREALLHIEMRCWGNWPCHGNFQRKMIKLEKEWRCKFQYSSSSLFLFLFLFFMVMVKRQIELHVGVYWWLILGVINRELWSVCVALVYFFFCE